MPDLTHWTSKHLDQIKRDMEHLFESLRRDMGMVLPPGGTEPTVSLEETEAELLITLEAPGFVAEDLSVGLEDDTLHLRGSRRQEVEGGTGGAVSRSVSLSHSLRLPCAVQADQAQATFRDGRLRIVLPKRPPEGRVNICVKVE
jgi:HSP20 family protein